jgi:hypothetical protein
MKYLVGLSIIVILLQGQSFGAQLDLKDKVALQVSRIKSISGYSEEGFFELPGVSLPEEDSPITQLINYGMDAIPFLIPYLSDTSPTKAYRHHGGGMKRQAVVNEYVIFIIHKIAAHIFYVPHINSDLPANIAELEDQINLWWQANRTKSLLERKLNDLNDQIHSNRFSAYEWLGRARAKEARTPLAQRITTLLTGEVNSLKQSDMAACAEVLGLIGDRNSAPIVCKVCDHLSYWLRMAYRPIEEGRSGTWSGQIATLFKAYEALARLGFKEEALFHLAELKTQCLMEMEPSNQEDYQTSLKRAVSW